MEVPNIVVVLVLICLFLLAGALIGYYKNNQECVAIANECIKFSNKVIEENVILSHDLEDE